MEVEFEFRPSPDAAADLLTAIVKGMSPFAPYAERMQGLTDCDHGCEVEPDGRCPHGYNSAAITAGVI